MNPEPLLKDLKRGGVKFVIVGGAAMVIHGSAYLTDDLDIVYARDPDNIQKLVVAIKPFKPRLRTIAGGVSFRFDERTVKNGLNFALTTTHGNIDILGEIAGLGGFASVQKHVEKVQIGNQAFDVLSLGGLIRSKKAAGRPKDLLVIPELKALEELNKHTELAE